MYLKQMGSGDLVEVIDLPALFDPCVASLRGRIHAGEELQDPADFAKSDLVFPSGEGLPRCWLDPNYRVRLKIA
jgi:hypothetical protein